MRVGGELAVARPLRLPEALTEDAKEPVVPAAEEDVSVCRVE